MRMAVGRGRIVDRKGPFATVRERTSDALQGVINSPIMPEVPSDHQMLPLGSTVIKCGLKLRSDVVRILYRHLLFHFRSSEIILSC
jgi:hypothetical protein